MRRLLGLAKRLLPADSAIGRFVRRLVPSALISPARRGYRRYVKNVEPGLWSPRVAQDRVDPLFSVVIPMFNTPCTR